MQAVPPHSIDPPLLTYSGSAESRPGVAAPLKVLRDPVAMSISSGTLSRLTEVGIGRVGKKVVSVSTLSNRSITLQLGGWRLSPLVSPIAVSLSRIPLQFSNERNSGGVTPGRSDSWGPWVRSTGLEREWMLDSDALEAL